jgi:hypothetical protein
MNRLDLIHGAVYVNAREIGTVECRGRNRWEALDYAGRSHGDRWLSAWYAAEALQRALGLA